MIVDDFLASYPELKAYSKACEFGDIENPVDGVVYPSICAEIPDAVKQEVTDRLSQAKGSPIENVTLFMRMTKHGTPVPHIAHTDAVMGRYAFMLYLNTHPLAGTSFLRHKASGITYQPETQEYCDVVVKDQNDIDKWVRTFTAQAQENRALFYDSGLFHCADPVGGFGLTQETARIVLTCFYD